MYRCEKEKKKLKKTCLYYNPYIIYIFLVTPLSHTDEEKSHRENIYTSHNQRNILPVNLINTIVHSSSTVQPGKRTTYDLVDSSNLDSVLPFTRIINDSLTTTKINTIRQERKPVFNNHFTKMLPVIKALVLI